jgi:hypothetical protein
VRVLPESVVARARLASKPSWPRLRPARMRGPCDRQGLVNTPPFALARAKHLTPSEAGTRDHVPFRNRLHSEDSAGDPPWAILPSREVAQADRFKGTDVPSTRDMAWEPIVSEPHELLCSFGKGSAGRASRVSLGVSLEGLPSR